MWSLLRKAHLLVLKAKTEPVSYVMPSQHAPSRASNPEEGARGEPSAAPVRVELEADGYSDILPAMLVRGAESLRPHAPGDEPRVAR